MTQDASPFDKAMVLVIAALLLIMAFLMSGCASDRAKVAADTRAGVQALRAAFAAGVATSEALAILNGIDARLPAVAGVNSADWPAPEWTPDRIQKDPKAYGDAAPPEPTRWDIVAIASTAGMVGLWLAKNLAPLVPGGGTIVASVADLGWAILASRKQKEADKAKELTCQAAAHLAPILAAAASLPPGTLPENVEQAMRVPLVQAALAHLGAALLPPIEDQSPARDHA